MVRSYGSHNPIRGRRLGAPRPIQGGPTPPHQLLFSSPKFFRQGTHFRVNFQRAASLRKFSNHHDHHRQKAQDITSLRPQPLTTQSVISINTRDLHASPQSKWLPSYVELPGTALLLAQLATPLIGAILGYASDYWGANHGVKQ